MINFPFETAALRVTQPLGTFYVAILPAELLLRVASSDVMSATLHADGIGYSLTGTQRLIQDKRLTAIADYIDRIDAVCPTISSPLAALAPNVLIRANYFAIEWRKTQPLVLLKKAKTLPPSFVTACSADEFGSFTGPKAWSGQANQLWSNSRWVPGPTGCDHFQWPARAVLDFLGPHKIHSAPVAAVGVEHR